MLRQRYLRAQTHTMHTVNWLPATIIILCINQFILIQNNYGLNLIFELIYDDQTAILHTGYPKL